MKTTGNTVEGKLLVEMSKQEHEAFKELEAAVDGLTSSTMFHTDMKALRGLDLSDTFQAITLYVKARFLATEIKDMGEQFESLLKKKE